MKSGNLILFLYFGISQKNSFHILINLNKDIITFNGNIFKIISILQPIYCLLKYPISCLLKYKEHPKQIFL